MEKKQVSKRILLIDDDAVINMINTKLITRNFDFSVSAYTDAQEALDQFRIWLSSSPDLLPDLIFLDINMPVMDGWEFLKEFQKLPEKVLEKCNLFMLSSSIDHDDVEKAKSYTAVREFISKPLTPDKLKMLAAA